MAKNKSSKKSAVNKKSRKGIVKSFREVISELKKVSWPSTKELINSTAIVVVLILIFAAVIGIVDFGLGQLFTLIS